MKAAILALLAGCSLVTTSTTPRSATTPQPVSHEAAPASREAPERPEPPVHHHAGIIGREQLEALKSLSPERAKQELAKLGYVGDITIVVQSGHDYVKGCGENQVCGTSGGSGIGLHDELILYVNPTLTIAPP